MTLPLLVGGVLLLAACGGDDDGPGDSSGVDGAKPITELSDSEKEAFCGWATEAQGGAGHQTDCGGGITVTVSTEEDCVDDFERIPAACSVINVSELEACVEAEAADPCPPFDIPECGEYAECLRQG